MVNFSLRRLTATQIIVIGYLAVILIGSLLLCLPAATRDGIATPFIDSLFTATSATCVTGLIVHDTYTYWSLFGQLVIISLIQFGGLGFMSIITLFTVFLGRSVTLHSRSLFMQTQGTFEVGGTVRLIKKIAIGTVLFEGLGAIAFAIRFCPEMGFVKGLYTAVFHSVSAFCNAGFDLMGQYGEFSSLAGYAGDVTVNVTVMLLIIIGGIGFWVWSDILRSRFRFKNFQLHTKIVTLTTAVLIFGGAVLFFLFEYNASFAALGTGEKILAAFFQSVSPRTAGFATVNLSELSDSGNLLMMFLMLVGGSPGSTAGGIKTTTLFVLILDVIASAKKSPELNIFKRRLETGIVKQAAAIATIYLSAVVIFTMVICAIQPLALKDVLFEVISAVGTVGLTTGITTSLGTASRIIITVLMFGGRVGILSLALLFAEKRENVPIARPSERIIIG